MANIDGKQAATALGMLAGLWIANVVIAVVAAIVGAVAVLFTQDIAFWVLWVSAYGALIALHRAHVVATLWRIVSK